MNMTLNEIIEQVKEICISAGVAHLSLFGSYAAGNPTKYSDIDFFVKGCPDIDKIREQTEMIPTLKTIDLFDYDRCTSQDLREDMDKYGKEIY
jgi:predicted nucleotidyltransferase